MYVFALHEELDRGWEYLTPQSTEHPTVFRVYWYLDFTIFSGKKSARQKYRPKWQKYAEDHFRSCSWFCSNPRPKSLGNFLGQSCQRLNASLWMQQADRIRNAEERRWDGIKSLFSTMCASIRAENSVCVVKTLQYIIYRALDSKSRCSGGGIHWHCVAGHHGHADACHVFWTKAAEKPCDATF